MRYKYTFALTVAVVGVLFLAGVGTVAGQSAPDCSTVSYDGDGTDTNPYEVGNVDQLQCIEEQGLGANYTQISAIDASDTSSWNGGDGFDPIGDTDPATPITPFTGTYDGQRFNITDLTIDRTEPSVGLFDFVADGGEVTNASVVNADITGPSLVGGLAAGNDGRISKSFVSGSVGGTNSGVVGGLAAENGVGATINESYSTASVEGSGTVGGLAAGNDGTVEKSYARGSVDGDTTVAGLVAANGGTIEESYATGSVSDPVPIPGPGNPVGGLVAINDRGTVDDSYWDEESTGQDESDGGTGLTTSEMTGSAATSNMAGFEFTDTWNTVTNPDDYPILAWQTQDDDDGGGGGGASIDDIQTSLSDTDGDDLPDRVEADVTVSDVGTGQTIVELGESSFDVDVSPTDTQDGNQAQFVTPQDTDGDGTSEAVEFVGLGSVSTTYTVTADLSGQADGDTGTVTVELGGGTTDSATYTVEEATGPLDPNNPFGDSGNNPVDRSTVIDRVVEWNLNGEIGGTTYTRSEIINFVVGWNLAS